MFRIYPLRIDLADLLERVKSIKVGKGIDLPHNAGSLLLISKGVNQLRDKMAQTGIVRAGTQVSKNTRFVAQQIIVLRSDRNFEQTFRLTIRRRTGNIESRDITMR